MTKGSGPIVGIDLGTTNSLVAVAAWPPGDAAAPRCLADEQGRVMLPSIVRFDVRGDVASVGEPGEVLDPLRTVWSVKRLMGRTAKDAEGDAEFLGYRVVDGPRGSARVAITVDGGEQKLVSPQEVSAIILRELKQRAEHSLGVSVERVVVTVPAYFDDAQRQATRDAGRLAGLEVVRILNEPTAAALAYGLGIREALGASGRSRTVVVYDLGGGTFDVSVLRITPAASDTGDKAVADYFQVLSTYGDTHLGGDDMDAAMVGLLSDGRGGRDGMEMAGLRLAARRAKEQLSEEDSTTLRVRGEVGEEQRTVTREAYERAIGPLVERTIVACRRAMTDARRVMSEGEGGQAEGVDAVILVGGATRTPLVRRRVSEEFGITPYTALNPDEVVALGAAVQGAMLSGGAKSGLLLDVVPLSLGIETVGGAMAKMVMRNATVPARASEMFSTSVDNQTGIKLHVLQGEREMAADCRSLARFELKGIPPMPAGIPKLRVEFLVDASGVLTVRASEERSGKRLEAQVVPNHGLTKQEVERIERESYLNAREDMRRHRVTDLITHASFDLGMIDRQLSRHSAAMTSEAREALLANTIILKEMIGRAREDWRSVDPDSFQRAKEAMDRASMPLHELSIRDSLNR